MKKLVMMAMVLGMGIAANAAVTQWSLAAFCVPTVDGDGNVTLDTSTAMTWAGGNYKLYIINQATDHVGELVEVNVSPTISSTGAMAATTLFSQDDSVSMRDAYGKDGYLYMQIVGSYSDGSYDYSYDSGVLSKSLKNITGSTNAKFSFSGGPMNWTPTPVPEPTSGLLLLLGVAGMALRRRRA